MHRNAKDRFESCVYFTSFNYQWNDFILNQATNMLLETHVSIFLSVDLNMKHTP